MGGALEFPIDTKNVTGKTQWEVLKEKNLFSNNKNMFEGQKSILKNNKNLLKTNKRLLKSDSSIMKGGNMFKI